MPTFSNIDGEESSTVTFTVGAVSLTRNSSAELQEILCIGDPDVASSLGLARVTNTAPASSNAGLNVRILSGPSSVADFAVRAVLPSTYGDHGLRVLQSSAADLNVTVGNFSTTVNVSSLAGAVVVRSSAADHLASVYQSTFTDLNCRINAPSTCNSSNYLPVRLTNSTAFLEPASDYVHAVAMTVSTVAGPAVMLRASSTKPPAVSTSDMWVTQWGSLHGSAYVSMATDSGVSIMDSTASALKVNVVAGSAAGDTTVTVSTGSVRVHQSTAADLNVTVAGYSTTVNVSSLGGAVITRSSAADHLGTVYQSTFANLCVTAHNSTIGDFLASVQQNSTVWQVQAKIMDSSAVTPNIVGTRPTTGAQGFAVRTVLNDLQSTCYSTIGNNSTSSTIVSSVAGQKVKVYAYSITSTVQVVNTLSFASSLADPRWHIQMQAMSSAISGANLAVTPPAWLFATDAAAPLVFKVTGTTGTYHLSVSYFIEA